MSAVALRREYTVTGDARLVLAERTPHGAVLRWSDLVSWTQRALEGDNPPEPQEFAF